MLAFIEYQQSQSSHANVIIRLNHFTDSMFAWQYSEAKQEHVLSKISLTTETFPISPLADLRSLLRSHKWLTQKPITARAKVHHGWLQRS